jgi:NitT/TauT family transport system ATP-binding protein
MVETPGASSAPTEARTVVVRVSDVIKHFVHGKRQLRALDGVSFELPEGRFLVVVGPSGCGKTTLLRILAGLEQQDSGEVWMRPSRDGHPPFAMVFQEQSVFPWLTVRDNVAYGLKLRRVRGRQVEERASHWIPQGRAERIRTSLSASALGRNEAAGLDRAGFRGRS